MLKMAKISVMSIEQFSSVPQPEGWYLPEISILIDIFRSLGPDFLINPVRM